MAAQVTCPVTRARHGPCHTIPALRMVDNHDVRGASMGEGRFISEEETSWESVSELTCGTGVSRDC
eukprot:891945-Rhodomonas_salina.1